ncbi:MAG: PEP-CTERM sorting domain-containing protein [Phycisphaerales bacterium]|nr:PEP-CTERM sorting domain-containing protein [Phycisphaerales bacterium]
MKRDRLFATIAVILIVPAFAQAGVVETASERFTLVAAEGGFNTDGPTRVDAASAFGLFDNISFANASMGGNGGSSNASQNSTIDPGNYVVDLDVRADAFGDGSDFASGYAESSFEVSFTLTSSEDFNIAGFGGAFGQINGETSKTEIVIESLGGGSPTQVIVSETDDFPSFDISGTLLPGDYKLTASSLAIVDRIFDNGFGDASASARFTMTITPEPSSIALLVIGGLAARRQRRQQL